LITQEYLKSILSYNQDSGEFVWKIRKGRITEGSRAGGSDNKNHRKINIDGTKYWEHKLAWLYVTGHYPISDLDHINGNGEDNRFCNLRLATHAQNMQNMKIPKHNTSGHVGVFFEKFTQKWRAQIDVNGKSLRLGRFKTIEEAIAVREEAKRNLHTFNPIQRKNA